jgi:nitrite reductase/ring-hydroxylating ferredoxin subunit
MDAIIKMSEKMREKMEVTARDYTSLSAKCDGEDSERKMKKLEGKDVCACHNSEFNLKEITQGSPLEMRERTCFMFCSHAIMWKFSLPLVS